MEAEVFGKELLHSFGNKEEQKMFSNTLVQVGLLLGACLFCLIMALCMYLSNNFDSKKRKWLLWMMLSTALLLFNDALAYIFRGYPGTVGYYLVRISNFMVFVLSNVIMFFFHVYVCSYLFPDDEGRNVRRARSVSYICALGIVLVIFSQFTDLYYYFDADNFYHRNTGYIISLLTPVSAMLIDLSLLLQFRKNIRKKIFISMLSYIVLPLMAVAIQTFWYGVSLINLSIGMAMIFMYIASMSEQNWEMYQLLKKKTEIEERLSISMTLNQCVKALSSDVDIDVAINKLLGVINEYFEGDRSYIFQLSEDGKTLKNTYEYVKEGITAQIENLQAVPIEAISTWMECFQRDEVYFMSNIEQENGSEAHDILQEQPIDRRFAVPLKEKKKIIGFLGVDNPQNHYDDATLLSSIQYFIINSIERKERQQQLEDLSYRDMLTGLYNRNKYIMVVESYNGKSLHNVGVAYIDLNGLKKMNDVHGHESGDGLICRAASAIMAVFPETGFRVGGDEFVIAKAEISEEQFLRKMDQLHEEMESRQVSVSVGVLWREEENDIVGMLKQADNIMYEAKRKYHLMER